MAVQRDRPYPGFNFLVDLGTGATDGPDAGFEELLGPLSLELGLRRLPQREREAGRAAPAQRARAAGPGDAAARDTRLR